MDFQEIDLPTGVPRRVMVLPVPCKTTICIGVRRSGKSTFIFQPMTKLQVAGVVRETICGKNNDGKGVSCIPDKIQYTYLFNGKNF
jgi:hypothetical protein